MQYSFGPFAPDAEANTIGICTIAQGVLPTNDGYGPAPSLIRPGTGALPGAPRGGITCIKRDGTAQVFMFTASAFYRLDASYAYVEVDNGYSCTPGDDWSCEQFGNMLLYTNTTDGLWAYDIELNTPPVYVAAAGDPREIFVNANMVFALDCKDNAGVRNNRLIRNSDFNDHTDWTGGAADQQPLETGAELLGGIPLKNGAALVLQRASLRLIQFGNAGGGAMYSLPEVAAERGSVGRKSIIGFDGTVYFLATNGFWRFSQGGLEAIGDGLVDKTFLKLVPTTQLKDVQAAIDPARKVVLWLVPATGVVYGYSWGPNIVRRWFTWQTDITFLSRLATSGYTWNAAGAIWPTWDDMPAIPFNDRFWQGGEQFLSGVGSDGIYATFSGDAMEATLRGSTQNSPVSSLIGWATPIDDAPNSTLRLGVSDRLSDPISWKDPASKTASGRTPQRGRGMNILFEWSNPAGEEWTFVKGVDHIGASGGGPK